MWKSAGSVIGLAATFLTLYLGGQQILGGNPTTTTSSVLGASVVGPPDEVAMPVAPDVVEKQCPTESPWSGDPDLNLRLDQSEEPEPCLYERDRTSAAANQPMACEQDWICTAEVSSNGERMGVLWCLGTQPSVFAAAGRYLPSYGDRDPIRADTMSWLQSWTDSSNPDTDRISYEIDDSCGNYLTESSN